MDNRINPAEQTTPESAGSGRQEAQTIENGEDQTAQNDSNIGKQFTHPMNIFNVNISIGEMYIMFSYIIIAIDSISGDLDDNQPPGYEDVVNMEKCPSYEEVPILKHYF